MISSPKNPWKDFYYNSNSNNCLDSDKSFCDAYTSFLWEKASKHGRGSWSKAKIKENELHLDLFPEPFLGSPDVPIYLLGGNPGYGESNNDWKNIEVYNNYMANNLSHKGDFVYFNQEIRDNDGNNHGGYEWWMKHVNVDLRNQIFDIEYFPYHTMKLDGLKAFLDTSPDVSCGSNKYADELINIAMKEGKTIIITRMQSFWLNRIKLENYDNLYVVLDHQSARIDNGNIIRYSKFLELKKQSWNEIIRS